MPKQSRMTCLNLLLLSSVAFSASACSDSKEGGNASNGGIGEKWKGACVATFTQDYEVIDPFGDPELTVKKGAQYLIGSTDFGEVELIEVTADGPATFSIEPEGDNSENLPFTSDCDLETAEEHRGVFADVTVYSDKALTKKLCELKNGDQRPAGDQGFGYGSDFDFDAEELVYEVRLGALSALCDGNEQGFIGVPSVQIRDTTTSLVPLQTFLKPGA